jgi:hypothetical protein
VQILCAYTAPALSTTTEAQEPSQKLTTATQSVGDYFKAKLCAKAQQPRPNSAPAALDDDDGPLRAGLGASRSVATEAPSDERKRGGIGASSKFAAMFALGRATPDTGDGNVDVDVDVTRDADGCDDGDEDEDDRGKSEKRRAKEKRRKAKEERRRKRAGAGSGTAAGSLDGEAMDGPVGETLGGKKRRELRVRESRLEGAPNGSGMEDIPTKKWKKRDKDRKSSKDRNLEE